MPARGALPILSPPRCVPITCMLFSDMVALLASAKSRQDVAMAPFGCSEFQLAKMEELPVRLISYAPLPR